MIFLGPNGLSTESGTFTMKSPLMGSGEGGTSDKISYVLFEDGQSGTKVSDKTTDEILADMLAGKIIIGIFKLMMSESVPLVISYSFIQVATGSYSVTFNGNTYNAREGNVWETY